MAEYANNGLSVPVSFARALAEWKGASFAAVMRDVNLNLTGRMMNRITGKTLTNVQNESGLISRGFKISTSMPSLIAWMLGSRRKAYFVKPKKQGGVLSWTKNGKRFFSRGHMIPAWKFTPIRPVFDNALERNKDLMETIYTKSIFKQLNNLFPDVRVRFQL